MNNNKLSCNQPLIRDMRDYTEFRSTQIICQDMYKKLGCNNASELSDYIQDKGNENMMIQHKIFENKYKCKIYNANNSNKMDELSLNENEDNVF